MRLATSLNDGGALVRRDDQVRVVLRIDQVEHAADEGLVRDPHRLLGRLRGLLGRLRRTAEHEPALRARWARSGRSSAPGCASGRAPRPAGPRAGRCSGCRPGPPARPGGGPPRPSGRGRRSPRYGTGSGTSGTAAESSTMPSGPSEPHAQVGADGGLDRPDEAAEDAVVVQALDPVAGRLQLGEQGGGVAARRHRSGPGTAPRRCGRRRGAARAPRRRSRTRSGDRPAAGTGGRPGGSPRRATSSRPR